MLAVHWKEDVCLCSLHCLRSLLLSGLQKKDRLYALQQGCSSRRIAVAALDVQQQHVRLHVPRSQHQRPVRVLPCLHRQTHASGMRTSASTVPDKPARHLRKVAAAQGDQCQVVVQLA